MTAPLKQNNQPAWGTTDNYPFDLGSFGRAITTSSPAAQTWFNRGLAWVYTFNHMEAVNCFRRALSNDPSCAMAYWGIAFALGPNYNHPYELFDDDYLKAVLKETYHASRKAKSLSDSGTAIEKGLIDAINVRFQHECLVPVEQLVSDSVDYSDAMKALYEKAGNDLDVACLYADSMMTLTPWKLYDLTTGEPADGSCTLESREVLERALTHRDARQHPGLLHMYIHLSEMSPYPERGLCAADSLRDLVPDAGHSHHMPIHLDNLVGDYCRAISSNTHATLADDKYYAYAGGQNFYSLYRLHNYHFLIYAAMFAGKKTIALETVERMEGTLPEEILRAKSPNLADWLEGFVALQHAIHLEDSLVFSEPWGWMQPVRHAYAALSFEQGDLVAAAEAYEADLGLDKRVYRAHHHPNNVWALQGYHECLTRLGRDLEASLVEPQLKIALAVADIPIKASCFCR